MARRCKELRNIHQIKLTVHCLGINLTSIRVLWDHICLNSCRFVTSVVWEMWSDRVDSMFHSLIGRFILKNWAFAPQLGVLIPRRDSLHAWSCSNSVYLVPLWLTCNTLSVSDIRLGVKYNGCIQQSIWKNILIIFILVDLFEWNAIILLTYPCCVKRKFNPADIFPLSM